MPVVTLVKRILVSLAFSCAVLFPGCLQESISRPASDSTSHPNSPAGEGPPVVTGFHARLNLNSGFVSLYWDRMDSPPRDRYYLNHRLEGVPHPIPNPIAATR